MLMFLFLGTVYVATLLVLLVYVLVRSAERQSRQLEKEEKLKSEHHKARIREGEMILNEISREIHDNIGQLAYTLRMHLHVIKRLASDPMQISTIDNMAEVADKMIGDTSNISRSLNREYIQAHGLHNMIEKVLKHVAVSNSLKYNFNISGNIRKLIPEAKVLVLRIVQEALSNVVKHSSATCIDLKIIYKANSFLLRIKDNGLGFSVDREMARTGMGLNNMRERAELLGGKLFIEAMPGRGCTLVLSIKKIKYSDL